jgi:EPS-associated MarR family transcriptional regulator
LNIEHLNLLKELSRNNTLSQRELSNRLDLSLGKVNYLLSSLMEKGLLKANRFKNSNNKLAYMYNLTPLGVAEKINMTRNFLRRKMDEYDALKEEIKELETDVARFKE